MMEFPTPAADPQRWQAWLQQKWRLERTMILAVSLGAFYWVFDAFLMVLLEDQPDLCCFFFGRPDHFIRRLLVLALFLIFGLRARSKIRSGNRAADATAHGTDLLSRNKYLEALHEITLGLIHRLDLKLFLQNLLERAAALADTPNGFLYLFDPETGQLRMQASIGLAAAPGGGEVKKGEGLAGQVWQQEKTIAVADCQLWSGESDPPISPDIRAAVAIPLKTDSKVIGVMGLGHHETGKRIEERDIEMLKRFAELASLALDHAMLHAQMQHELAERVRIERERHAMEIQLRRSQKLEAIGTLAGGIAHDFNNILGAIVGYTELSLISVPGESKTHNHLNQVLNAGYRARDLVRQILSFSRQSSEDKALINITPIVKEALKLLRASLPTTIEIRQEIDKDPGLVMANPTEIHQVIMNLCTNAAHAMKDGGVLRVSINGPVPGQAGPHRESRHLCLTVSDTGHGMGADIIDRIFDPYFTTKDSGKGTGLGLAITHRIVQDHGGTIQVRSTPGNGATFAVRIPVVTDETAEETLVSESLPGGSEHILLIDDEIDLLEIGKEMLERLGYRVSIYQNPLEMLDAITAAPDACDLVITDMTMPQMTGDRLARRIHALRPGLPVVVSTGFSERMDQSRATEIGIRALIMKPISISQLSKTVRRVLDQRAPQPQPET